MEYKTLEFKDSRGGRKDLEKSLNKLAGKGWRVSDMDSKQGKISVTKTIALGAVFLPLALKGRKKGRISVLLERDN